MGKRLEEGGMAAFLYNIENGNARPEDGNFWMLECGSEKISGTPLSAHRVMGYLADLREGESVPDSVMKALGRLV